MIIIARAALDWRLILWVVCVSAIMIAEIKKIIKESEIMK